MLAASRDTHTSSLLLCVALSGPALLLGCGQRDAAKPAEAAAADGASPATAAAEPEPGAAGRAFEVHGLKLDRSKRPLSFRAKVTRRAAGGESPDFMLLTRCYIGAHVVRSEWESRLPGALEVGSLELGETMRIVFKAQGELPTDISRCELEVLESADGKFGAGSLRSSHCWAPQSEGDAAKAGPCAEAPSATNKPWSGSSELQIDVHRFEDSGPSVRLMGFVNANVDVSAHSGIERRRLGGPGFVMRASCLLEGVRWVEHRWVETPTAQRFKPDESLLFYVPFFAGVTGLEPARDCRFEAIVPERDASAVYCLAAARELPAAECESVGTGERVLASADTVELGGVDMRPSGSPAPGPGRLWVAASASLLGERVLETSVACAETTTKSTPAQGERELLQLGEAGTRLDAGERTWFAFHNAWSEPEAGEGCELRVALRDGSADAGAGGEDIGLFCFNSGGSVPGSCEGAVLPAPKPEPGAGNSRAIAGAEQAIQCTESGDSCTIERAFVNELFRSPAMLAKQARIVPGVRDGEVRGYKFYGIRPGSLLKLLGFKNGDMLVSINGTTLDSLDAAMAAYNKLRERKHLSVVYERKGSTQTVEIEIR